MKKQNEKLKGRITVTGRVGLASEIKRLFSFSHEIEILAESSGSRADQIAMECHIAVVQEITDRLSFEHDTDYKWFTYSDEHSQAEYLGSFDLKARFRDELTGSFWPIVGFSSDYYLVPYDQEMRRLQGE